MASSVVTLSVGQNGRITIPADFRKEHSLDRGGKVLAVAVGETLVIAPEERAIESILNRLQKAAKAARTSVDELSRQALEERAAIVRDRYGSQPTSSTRKPRRARSHANARR